MLRRTSLRRWSCWGLFSRSIRPRFRRPPSSLSSASSSSLGCLMVYESTFQQMKNRVLSGLPFIFVYLDNILVASPDHTTQKQHRCEVIRHLHENCLTINLLKSVFGQEKIRFQPQASGHSLATCRLLSPSHLLPCTWSFSSFLAWSMFTADFCEAQ